MKAEKEIEQELEFQKASFFNLQETLKRTSPIGSSDILQKQLTVSRQIRTLEWVLDKKPMTFNEGWSEVPPLPW